MKTITQFLLVLSLFLSGCTFHVWSRSDEFVSGLRCGQSLEEVEKYAEHFDTDLEHSGQLTDYDNVPELDGRELQRFELHHPEAYLTLGFRDRSLETAQVSWDSGVKKTTVKMRVNLCTGEMSSQVFVSVRIPNGSGGSYGGRFAKADEIDILINDKIRAPSNRFWLPSGRYEISVRLASGEERRMSLNNTDKDKDGHILLIFYPEENESK